MLGALRVSYENWKFKLQVLYHHHRRCCVCVVEGGAGAGGGSGDDSGKDQVSVTGWETGGRCQATMIIRVRKKLSSTDFLKNSNIHSIFSSFYTVNVMRFFE